MIANRNGSAGFVGLSPEVGTEPYAPAPYPVGADLGLDGLMLSDQPHRAAFVSQECDFACGELRSVFTYAGSEVTATVEVLTFCSRTQPALVLQEIGVTVDRACKLILQAHLDPSGLPGKLGERVRPGLRTASRGDHGFAWSARPLPRTAHAAVQGRRAGQAAREGRLAEAAERVAAAIEAHWQPDFGAWREYGQHWNLGVFDMDCFLTNPGALLRLLLLDFPGLKIGSGAVESWAAEPVALPAGWDAIEIERVWARGEPWRLTARQGAERAGLEMTK